MIKGSSNNLYLECIGFVPILFISLCCFGAKWWYGVQVEYNRVSARTLSVEDPEFWYILHNLYWVGSWKWKTWVWPNSGFFKQNTSELYLTNGYTIVILWLWINWCPNVIPSNERLFWEVDSSDRDRLYFPTYYSYFLRKQ